ncbi:MAG: hypothetical protein ACI9CP_002049 [Cryomorphaceae bacterium]|jgi:hypothetical protein
MIPNLRFLHFQFDLFLRKGFHNRFQFYAAISRLQGLVCYFQLIQLPNPINLQ